MRISLVAIADGMVEAFKEQFLLSKKRDQRWLDRAPLWYGEFAATQMPLGANFKPSKRERALFIALVESKCQGEILRYMARNKDQFKGANSRCTRVTERLDELKGMQDGWLDGEGTAPTDAALDWLIAWFGVNFDVDLPIPHLYPTLAGGVQAEWSLGAFEISLNIDIIQHTAYWHLCQHTNNDILDDDCEARWLNLDQYTDVQWLVDSLSKLADLMPRE
jgi:hypothetical protein